MKIKSLLTYRHELTHLALNMASMGMAILTHVAYMQNTIWDNATLYASCKFSESYLFDHQYLNGLVEHIKTNKLQRR